MVFYIPISSSIFLQVQRKDAREVWNCYQAIEKCDYEALSECGLRPTENGSVGETPVLRAMFTVGNSE